MESNIRQKAVLVVAIRRCLLRIILAVCLTGTGHAGSNSSCQIEKVFYRYQKAVLADAGLENIRPYFAKRLVATVDHYIANVDVDEKHLVIEMGYLSAARDAVNVFEHAVRVRGDTGCLAIDSYSSADALWVNVVVEFTREDDKWRISDIYRVTTEADEPWYFTNKSRHRSFCLRLDWPEFEETNISRRLQNETRPFSPSCDSPLRKTHASQSS